MCHSLRSARAPAWELLGGQQTAAGARSPGLGHCSALQLQAVCGPRAPAWPCGEEGLGRGVTGQLLGRTCGPGLVGRGMEMHAQVMPSGLVIGRTSEVLQSCSLAHEGIHPRCGELRKASWREWGFF